WLISQIPLNSDILNPIEKTFSDFKLTDIYFSHLKESPDVSDDIVVVNIGELSRHEIAAMVDILNKYNPKVIGIDAFFRHPKDPVSDSLLAAAFANTKNLILVSQLVADESGSKIEDISYSNPMFMQYAKSGFANMITEGEHKFKVAREITLHEEVKGRKLYAFAVELARRSEERRVGKECRSRWWR